MLVVIIGESCTGKSTLADRLSNRLEAKIFTGKDYLRLAKNEKEANVSFTEILKSASDNDMNIIYVISEREHLSFVEDIGFKVLVTAEIDTIKERFSRRMNGNLPDAVAMMLERKHGMFDDIHCNYRCTITDESIKQICNELLSKLNLS